MPAANALASPGSTTMPVSPTRSGSPPTDGTTTGQPLNIASCTANDTGPATDHRFFPSDRPPSPRTRHRDHVSGDKKTGGVSPLTDNPHRSPGLLIPVGEVIVQPATADDERGDIDTVVVEHDNGV